MGTAGVAQHNITTQIRITIPLSSLFNIRGTETPLEIAILPRSDEQIVRGKLPVEVKDVTVVGILLIEFYGSDVVLVPREGVTQGSVL